MTDGSDQPLGYLLNRVAVALRAELTTAVLEPFNLTFPQYICMRMLFHAPGKSNAELAREYNVSPQAMNMVVRGLQDRRLVARPATVSSGRSLPTELTREGVALLKRTEPGLHEAEQRVLSPLKEQDQRNLRRILAELG
jgi:DNA-binding MarR family transcriptional regulator